MPEFQCKICKLKYKDEITAQKCYAWCSVHNSCNFEIARQAVNKDKAAEEKLSDERLISFDKDMHNHGDKGDSRMMWMMLVCCMLPVLFAVLAGRGAGLPIWLVLGAAAVFAAFHFWGMRKSRGCASHSAGSAGAKTDGKDRMDNAD